VSTCTYLTDGGTQRFQVKLSDADLEQFDLAEEISALTSRAHGDGELILNDWNLDDAEVRARIELRPGSTPNAIPLGGSIALSGKVPRYDVESRLTSAPLGLELEIEGQLDHEILRAVYRARLKKTEDAWAWLEKAGFIAEETSDPRIRGEISMNGTVEGIPTAPRWTAAVSSAGLEVWDEPILFSANLDGDLNKASLGCCYPEPQVTRPRFRRPPGKAARGDRRRLSRRRMRRGLIFLSRNRLSTPCRRVHLSSTGSFTCPVRTAWPTRSICVRA
jgi:hypothetical protein